MTVLASEIKLPLMFGRCTDFQLRVLFDGGSLVLTGIPVGYKFNLCFLLALSPKQLHKGFSAAVLVQSTFGPRAETHLASCWRCL